MIRCESFLYSFKILLIFLAFSLTFAILCYNKNEEKGMLFKTVVSHQTPCITNIRYARILVLKPLVIHFFLLLMPTEIPIHIQIHVQYQMDGMQCKRAIATVVQRSLSCSLFIKISFSIVFVHSLNFDVQDFSQFQYANLSTVKLKLLHFN